MPTAMMIIVVPAALLLLAILYLIMGINAKTSSKLPPGYVGWRHIGEVYHLLKPSSPTIIGEFMTHRMSRFGKVFATNLLGRPAIVSADPELNCYLLQNESRLMEHAWPRPQMEMMGRTSMALQVGDAHKQLRAIHVRLLNSFKHRKSFLVEVNEFASSIVGFWKDGTVISIMDAAKEFAFNIIVKSVLGMVPGEPKTEKLRSNYLSLYISQLVFPIMLPCTKYWKSMKARKNIHEVIDQLVKERKKKREGITKAPEEDDDHLLGWVVENTDLSGEQMGDLLQGLIYGSYDSTSTSISLMIYFLEGCQEAIQQLREEHAHVISSKKGENLTWDDYKQMEFTHCVINETLRLGNVARFVPKTARMDIQFKGYEIPRGCKLFIFISSVHYDASNFEDPEHFNPWRWMQTSSAGMKMKTNNNNFRPFSTGLRQCPGAELARMQMMVFLQHLVLQYDWKLAKDDHPMALPNVTFRKGLPIKIQSITN